MGIANSPSSKPSGPDPRRGDRSPGDDRSTSPDQPPPDRPSARPAGDGASAGNRADGRGTRVAQQDAAAEQNGSPRPRHRARRWLLRAAVAVVLLLLLVIVAVQVVLWSNLPRSIVLRQIEREMGLRAEASSLATGWFGHTTLRDVKLGLPLAQESVLEVPEMRVRTNWLIGILLGGGADIRAIELDNPRLNVWQGPDGKWNVAEVAELLARTGGKKEGQEEAQEATPTAPPRLPALLIRGATVVVTDNAQRRTTIEDVTVTGTRDGELLYRYELAIPDRVAVTGRVVPGGNWRHEVTAKVQNLAPIARPFAPDFPDVKFDGEWAGEAAAGGGPAGRLRIDRLAVGERTAKGVVLVGSEDGVLAVRPESLSIDVTDAQGHPKPSAPPRTAKGMQAAAVAATAPTTAPAADPVTLRAVAGRITYDGTIVAADQLRLAGYGGYVLVNGRFTPAANAGELHAEWVGLGVPDGANQRGKLDATIARRLDGGPDVRATVATEGTLGSRSWNGQLQLAGAGANWNDVLWKLTAPNLRVKDKRLLSLDGLVVDARTRAEPAAAQPTPGGGTDPQAGQTVLDVTSIRLPDAARLGGQARYETGTGLWWLRLDGSGWPVAQLGGEPLAFRLDVGGDGVLSELRDLSLRAAGISVKATGSYDARLPEPVDVKVAVSHREERPQFRMIEDARRDMGVEEPTVRGTLQGELKVAGRLRPTQLKVTGNVASSDLAIRDRRIGEMKIAVGGQATPDFVELHTSMLKLLDGTWDLKAVYSFAEETTGITMAVAGLPLREVGVIAGQPDLAGRVDGEWAVYIPGPDASDAGQPRVEGRVVARDVRGPSLTADELAATINLAGGRLSVPVTGKLVGKNGAPDGSLKATVEMVTSNPRHIEIKDLAMANWAVAVPNNNAVLSAAGESKLIAIDLPDAKAERPENRKLRVTSPTVVLGSTLRMNGKEQGKAEVIAELGGRSADVRYVGGNLLGSEINGQAVVDFDHPLLAAGELRVAGLSAERMAELSPGFKAVTGTFDVHARLSPARSPAALEPLVLDLNLRSSRGAQYAESVELGDARFRAFLNLDPNWGLLRLVLEDTKEASMPPIEQPGQPKCPRPRPPTPAVNSIHIADGVLNVWGRVVRHVDEAGREDATAIATHTRLSWQCLDLNQIVHVGDKEAAPMPGRVNGQVVLWGTTAIRPSPAERRAQEAQLAAARPAPGQPAPGPGATPAVPPKAPLLDRLMYSLYGQGAVELRETNLANFGPIAFLYNAMHLGQNMNAPTGYGDATFRIESGTMNLTSLKYFNKGVEARAIATVRDLRKIPDSPIEGNIVGSIRPLKDINLPFFADLDQLIGAVQATSTSVAIEGTVRNPKPRLVLFEDLSNAMRDFLVGDTRSGPPPASQ